MITRCLKGCISDSVKPNGGSRLGAGEGQFETSRAKAAPTETRYSCLGNSPRLQVRGGVYCEGSMNGNGYMLE